MIEPTTAEDSKKIEPKQSGPEISCLGPNNLIIACTAMKDSTNTENFVNPLGGDFRYEMYPVSPLHIDKDSVEEAGEVPLPRKRNELRELSHKIKLFLDAQGPANRQEIANECCQAVEGLKERKTVRKRVYDALNVLVAASVIQKEGDKLILSNQQKLRHMFVRNQKEKLRNLATKYQGLKWIFERNRMTTKDKEVVTYPCLVIKVPLRSTYQVEMERANNSINTVISISGKYQIINSLHILRHMSQMNVDIPLELKSLLE